MRSKNKKRILMMSRNRLCLNLLFVSFLFGAQLCRGTQEPNGQLNSTQPSKKLQIAAGGIRGQAGFFPLTHDAIVTFGQSVAHWTKQKYNANKPCFLIGSDTRESCNQIKESLLQGLKKIDVEIYDAGIIPTPAINNLVQKTSRFHCGLMITASHNPFTDNGIKIFARNFGNLVPEDDKAIEALFGSYVQQAAQKQETASSQSVLEEALQLYCNNICSYFRPSMLLGLKIVLDCANGATFQAAPKIFSQLGATVITTSCKPNGKNINDHCGSTYPEHLQKVVLENTADIGFAFDGDGDRVIAVTKSGQIKDGDDLIKILLDHPSYHNAGGVVGTPMNNKGLEVYLNKHEKKMIRTSVGEQFVVQALVQNDLPIGGESCGHIVVRDYLNSGDGMWVALKVLESIIYSGNWTMETFPKQAQALINVPVATKKNLSQPPLCDIIKKHECLVGDGQVLVRYSNTENLLRILVETADSTVAQSVAHSLAHEIAQSFAT